MSKRSRSIKTTPQYLSAIKGGNEKSFLIVGSSLLRCEKFLSLSDGAKILYLDMVAEARGNINDFTFPLRTATEKYGCKNTSLRAHINELIDCGLIIRTSGASTRQKNTYRINPAYFISP